MRTVTDSIRGRCCDDHHEALPFIRRYQSRVTAVLATYSYAMQSPQCVFWNVLAGPRSLS